MNQPFQMFHMAKPLIHVSYEMQGSGSVIPAKTLSIRYYTYYIIFRIVRPWRTGLPPARWSACSVCGPPHYLCPRDSSKHDGLALFGFPHWGHMTSLSVARCARSCSAVQSCLRRRSHGRMPVRITTSSPGACCPLVLATHGCRVHVVRATSRPA